MAACSRLQVVDLESRREQQVWSEVSCHDCPAQWGTKREAENRELARVEEGNRVQPEEQTTVALKGYWSATCWCEALPEGNGYSLPRPQLQEAFAVEGLT